MFFLVIVCVFACICDCSKEKRRSPTFVPTFILFFPFFIRGPFNLQPENMDGQLFEDGLGIAADLDERFGKPKTRVLSQRDVPGEDCC